MAVVNISLCYICNGILIGIHIMKCYTTLVCTATDVWNVNKFSSMLN